MFKTIFFEIHIVLLVMVWLMPSMDAQQTKLTLHQAVSIGLEKNPARKLAAADVASAEAGLRLSKMPLLPQIGFTEGFTRGNDPVYVFGTRLRQQRFQASDFSLNRLNRPTPIDNFNMSLAGRWTAFDSLHTQYKMKHASLVKDSATSSAGRSDQEIIYHVISAYESVLMVGRDVEVAQHTVDTSQALMELSRNRVDTGLAVEADALSAAVNRATRQQELIEAQGRQATAWVEFEAAVGVSFAQGPESLEPLVEHAFSGSPLPEEITEALKSRADLHSVAIQTLAQQTAVKSAKAEFGPRVDVFGSWQTDRQTIAGAGGNNWAAGGEIRIDLMPFEKRARLQQEKAGLMRAEASEASTRSIVRVEVSRAYYEHQSAEQTVVVARSARTQAAESLRILRNRYEAGLATLTEVLRVEDADRQSQSGYWRAVYRSAISYASLRLATGTLNQNQVVNFQ